MNEIDDLMDLDPLSLTKPQLDAIIAYQRQRRAEREAGGGKRARKETGPKVSLTGLLENMTQGKAKAEPVIKRRL